MEALEPAKCRSGGKKSGERDEQNLSTLEQSQELVETSEPYSDYKELTIILVDWENAKKKTL